MGAIEKGIQLYRGTKGVIDDINRNGYEWYMHFLRHPIATWHYYRDRYEGNWPVSRFVWSVLWRTPLMAVPVLPALYVVNRAVGVILNPFAWKSNITKPIAMIATLGLGALAVTLPYMKFLARPEFLQSATLINEGVLPFAIKSALQAPMAIGILLWGSLLVGAGLMYAGKYAAQAINQKMVETTTRKHHIDNPKKLGQPVLPSLLMNIHKEVRMQHQALKNKLIEDPEDIKFIPATAGTIAWINNKATNNNIEAAEATVGTGKQLLGRLEKIMQAQKNGESLDQAEVNEVIVDATATTTTGTKSTLYRQWASEMGVVKDQYKADPEVALLAIEENKIIARSKLGS